MSGVELRPTERRQLVEFFPRILDRYDEAGLDDEMDRLMDVQLEITDGAEREPTPENIETDDWRLLCQALDKIDDTRAAWLSSKLARRAGLSPMQMGFSTATPVGPYWSGQDPVTE